MVHRREHRSEAFTAQTGRGRSFNLPVRHENSRLHWSYRIVIQQKRTGSNHIQAGFPSVRSLVFRHSNDLDFRLDAGCPPGLPNRLSVRVPSVHNHGTECFHDAQGGYDRGFSPALRSAENGTSDEPTVIDRSTRHGGTVESWVHLVELEDKSLLLGSKP